MEAGENSEKIQNESITHKIVRGLSGNKFDRMELIKSPHKLVRQAVLLNQRITEDEIVLITSLKTAETDVLVKIAEKRDWLKSYRVRYNLATNPKTCPWIALKLLPTLSKKDIRNISKNRDVPHVVRLEALKVGLKS